MNISMEQENYRQSMSVGSNHSAREGASHNVKESTQEHNQHDLANKLPEQVRQVQQAPVSYLGSTLNIMA